MLAQYKDSYPTEIDDVPYCNLYIGGVGGTMSQSHRRITLYVLDDSADIHQ